MLLMYCALRPLKIVLAAIAIACIPFALFAKDANKRTNSNILVDESTVTPASAIRMDAKEIHWNKTRRLSWNDFRGPISGDTSDDNTAAATYCGFGFETNVLTGYNKPEIAVYNTFYTDKSWVRDDERSQEVLIHEQGHFDLCELYTRKLREAFSKAELNLHNLKPTLSSIYESIQQEYVARQEQYEQDTQHGIDARAQQHWCNTIGHELQQAEKWMQ